MKAVLNKWSWMELVVEPYPKTAKPFNGKSFKEMITDCETKEQQELLSKKNKEDLTYQEYDILKKEWQYPIVETKVKTIKADGRQYIEYEYLINYYVKHTAKEMLEEINKKTKATLSTKYDSYLHPTREFSLLEILEANPSVPVIYIIERLYNGEDARKRQWAEIDKLISRPKGLTVFWHSDEDYLRINNKEVENFKSGLRAYKSEGICKSIFRRMFKKDTPKETFYKLFNTSSPYYDEAVKLRKDQGIQGSLGVFLQQYEIVRRYKGIINHTNQFIVPKMKSGYNPMSLIINSYFLSVFYKRYKYNNEFDKVISQARGHMKGIYKIDGFKSIINAHTHASNTVAMIETMFEQLDMTVPTMECKTTLDMFVFKLYMITYVKYNFDITYLKRYSLSNEFKAEISTGYTETVLKTLISPTDITDGYDTIELYDRFTTSAPNPHDLWLNEEEEGASASSDSHYLNWRG